MLVHILGDFSEISFVEIHFLARFLNGIPPQMSYRRGWANFGVPYSSSIPNSLFLSLSIELGFQVCVIK